MESINKVTLISSDNEKYEISSKAAKRSTVISNVLESYPEDSEIPIPNVTSKILKVIIEYLNHYENEEPSIIEKPLKNNFRECVNEWDYDFVNKDKDTIFEIILGANYMDIKPLLEVTCAKIASMINGKTTEEIREIFDIENDFSPEEEKQIQEEDKYITLIRDE